MTIRWASGTLILLSVLVAHTSVFAQGRMVASTRDPNLVINAWEGARHGTIVRLHNGCRRDNPDCLWIYHNRMLVSARDPKLAINAWGGAASGTVLRLSDQ